MKEIMTRIREQQRTDHHDHYQLLLRCCRRGIKILLVPSVILVATTTTNSSGCSAFPIPHHYNHHLSLLSTSSSSYYQSVNHQRTTEYTQRQQSPLLAVKSGNSGRSSSSSSSKISNSKSKKGFGSATTVSTYDSTVNSSTTTKTSFTYTEGRNSASAAAATTTPLQQPQQAQSQLQPPIVSKRDRDIMLQRLQQQYGGTTPSEIATGTQRKMTEYIQQLPLHLQTAVQLYTKLQQYNTTVSKLSIYQQTTMYSHAQMDEIRKDQQQLQTIYTTYALSNIDLHNVLQQMTWDTSAYAKMVQSQLGQMKPNMAQRIQMACSYMVEAVVTPTTTTAGSGGRCLDVGCGYGALVPILTTTTTTTSSSASTKTMVASQIYGIDISTEMIKCGQELYPDCQFITGDFLQYHHPTNSADVDTNNSDSDGYFRGIIFCSSLHDMPNMYLVLDKAFALLSNDPGSTIVIVHAQGAGHVQMQHDKNPMLVPQLLPTATELQTVIDSYNNQNNHNNNHQNNNPTTRLSVSLQLTVAPANANTPNDIANGYLAVIQRK